MNRTEFFMKQIAKSHTQTLPRDKTACAVTLIIFLLMALAGCSEPEQLSRGRKFLQADMIPEALSALQAAVLEKPDNPEIHYLLGAAKLKQSLGSRPQNSANLSAALQKNPEALKSFERALGLDPEFDTNLYGYALGSVFQSRGELARAAREYEKFARSKKGSPAETEDALYRAGQCSFAAGNFEDAAGSYERCVKQFPEGRFSRDAKCAMGESLLEAGEVRAALRAVENIKDADQATYVAARCREQLGESEEAKKLYVELAMKEAGDENSKRCQGGAVKRLAYLGADIPLRGLVNHAANLEGEIVGVKGRLEAVAGGELPEVLFSMLNMLQGQDYF